MKKQMILLSLGLIAVACTHKPPEAREPSSVNYNVNRVIISCGQIALNETPRDGRAIDELAYEMKVICGNSTARNAHLVIPNSEMQPGQKGYITRLMKASRKLGWGASAETCVLTEAESDPCLNGGTVKALKPIFRKDIKDLVAIKNKMTAKEQ